MIRLKRFSLIALPTTLMLFVGVLSSPAQLVAARTAGALVRTTMRSEVGVLLDELPTTMRGRVARALLAKPQAFWTQRAKTQLRLTTYRLVFRPGFYSGKGQLPLPPEPLWSIKLSGKPRRIHYQGHDVVAVYYEFSSVLLTDARSPGVSEPKLAKTGGTWREPFMLPIDPELVMQRTDFACMDEAQFPFGSVDSEEVDSFYDQDCGIESKLSNQGQCHATKLATQSCVDAVTEHIGKVQTGVTFVRLAWSSNLADAFRYGRASGSDPDLASYAPEFAPSRVVYQYHHSSSCAIVEHAVSGTGWRRLLEFTTADENIGNKALLIGAVDYGATGHSGELDRHHLFEFSSCHQHYHFRFYGDFTWKGTGKLVNSKKGFCLQSTGRTSNREQSPLHNAFSDCRFQGIEAGWVDEYKAGLPSQWLDTTTFPAGKGTRSFNLNPRGLLCEGKLLDARGHVLQKGEPFYWVKTGLKTEKGEPVEAPRCKLQKHWNANNKESAVETISQQGLGLINAPCTRGQIGPLRNCGFRKAFLTAPCSAGATVSATFSIPKGAAPQVVRLTEYSHVLKSPIPARYEDSYVPLSPGAGDQPSMLANLIVTSSAPKTIVFRCPSERTGGTYEPGGVFSAYSAPVFPDDSAAPIIRS